MGGSVHNFSEPIFLKLVCLFGKSYSNVAVKVTATVSLYIYCINSV